MTAPTGGGQSDRMSGRLVQSYSYTIPADPGWAQPRRHRGGVDAPIDRDDAPGGGGWQPNTWTDDDVIEVLDGSPALPHELGHRRTGNSHRGIMARGSAQQRIPVESLDRFQGGPSGPNPLLGAGGAAHGGLRAEGSADWMNPGASRRRADGGVVVRAPGFRPGYRYVPATQEHRQGLHMNRPTIRGVREKKIIKGSEKSLRTMGPIAPTSHSILPPYSTPAPQATASQRPETIGAGWVM